MLFRRKGRLRKEYDEKLITEIQSLKREWLNKKQLLDKCVDPSDDIILETKMAEVKYFSLFKEAKYRKVVSKH